MLRRSNPRRVIVALVVAAAVTAPLACTHDDGSQEAFCTEVRKVPSLESVLARFSETDPTVLADKIDQARTAYHDLADAAPGTIRGDTAEVVAVIDEVFDAVEAHPSDPAKVTATLRARVKQHPKLDAARTRVVRYADRQCKVQLDSTLDTGN